MEELWTIDRLLKWTVDFFRKKGIESPRLDAEVLLARVLKKERIYLYVHYDEPLEAAELAAFKAMVIKRAARVPVAYILGEKEFMGLTFKVSEAVLVPRPETEILVGEVISRLEGVAAPKLLDLGTGSGAICLSLLKNIEDATAETVDISGAALAVARENAAALGVADRVKFYQGDFLAPIEAAGEKGFNAIVSNPPYIPDADIAGLAPEVSSKEPRTALAGGKDGLDFYRRLAKGAPALMADGALLAVEIGIGQGEAVAKLFAEAGLKNIERIKDLADIERVVVAYK